MGFSGHAILVTKQNRALQHSNKKSFLNKSAEHKTSSRGSGFYVNRANLPTYSSARTHSVKTKLEILGMVVILIVTSVFTYSVVMSFSIPKRTHGVELIKLPYTTYDFIIYYEQR